MKIEGLKFTTTISRFEKTVTELNTWWDVGLSIESVECGNQYLPVTVYLKDIAADSDELALEQAIKSNFHIQVAMMVGQYVAPPVEVQLGPLPLTVKDEVNGDDNAD